MSELNESRIHAVRDMAVKMTEKLRQSEERFRALIQNASDIIAVITADGTLDYISPAWQRLLGYEAQEPLPGEKMVDLVYPQDRSKVESLLNQCLKCPSQNLTAEVRLQDAQGNWRAFEVILTNLLTEPSVAGIIATYHDITAQQQAATDLGDVWQQLNFHVENLPLAVIEWDRDFRVSRWSPAAESIFQWQAEEVLGKKLGDWQFIFAEDLTLVNQGITQLFHGSQQRNVIQNRNYTKDGSIVHCEWYNSALLDESGHFISVLSLILDITERKQVEEALQKSEKRYRDLADAMPLIVWTAQPEGNLNYFNQRWYDSTGMTFEQAKDYGWQLVVHPDDLQPCLDQWRLAIQTGKPYEVECRFKQADGNYRWHLGRAVPMHNSSGQIISWVGTGTDIDEQKQKEAADWFLAQATKELVSSLDYQQTLASVAQLAVPRLADWCVVDILEKAGGIQRVEVAHIEPAKVQLAWELYQRYPEDLTAPEGIPKVLRTGESELVTQVHEALLMAIAQDAEHLRILQELGLKSYMIVPLWARGRILGAITFVTAESKRYYTPADLKFAEELGRHAALAVDNARLFEAVQQELAQRKQVEAALEKRAEELAQLTKVLEQRNQELDKFAYVTSHDLKAPLRAIANLSEWLEEDLSEQLTPETQHQMNLLRGRVHRLEALIDGLLQYSRVGRQSISQEVVVVERVLAEVIDSLAPPPEFTIEIEPGMPTLVTERLLLEQVFANLIGNAIKHHNRVNGHVKVGVQRQGDFYQFTVTDDGPGIAPQYHEKVFIIFQTLEPRDKVESTGVGLSLVKKIIEDKGGMISLQSQVGQGARFSFTWPGYLPESG
jgi:PAS domain S-box-containing protein